MHVSFRKNIKNSVFLDPRMMDGVDVDGMDGQRPLSAFSWGKNAVLVVFFNANRGK